MTNKQTTKYVFIQHKIDKAKAKIIDAYEKNNGQLFVSFSGGKDSTVLLHLVRSIYPEIPAVFSNTTNEDKTIVKYIKTIENVITVFPTYYGKPINYLWTIEKFGFPLISKEVSQKVNELKNSNSLKLRNKRLYGDNKGNGKLANKHIWLINETFDVSNKCCYFLKKAPLLKYQNKTNTKPLIALMADESNLRKQLSLYGKDSEKKIYPFLKTGWTENDIWEYAKMFNIRFADCYYDRIINGELIVAKTRTGCEFCGFGILYNPDKFKNLKKNNLKLYKKTMNTSNNGITYRKALKIIKKHYKDDIK